MPEPLTDAQWALVVSMILEAKPGAVPDMEKYGDILVVRAGDLIEPAEGRVVAKPRPDVWEEVARPSNGMLILIVPEGYPHPIQLPRIVQSDFRTNAVVCTPACRLGKFAGIAGVRPKGLIVSGGVSIRETCEADYLLCGMFGYVGWDARLPLGLGSYSSKRPRKLTDQVLGREVIKLPDKLPDNLRGERTGNLTGYLKVKVAAAHSLRVSRLEAEVLVCNSLGVYSGLKCPDLCLVSYQTEALPSMSMSSVRNFTPAEYPKVRWDIEARIFEAVGGLTLAGGRSIIEEMMQGRSEKNTRPSQENTMGRWKGQRRRRQ